MPFSGFSGLPGETSHQISSSPSASQRREADPPMAAMGRIEGAAEEAGAGHQAAIAWATAARTASTLGGLGHDAARRGAMVSGIEGVGER